MTSAARRNIATAGLRARRVASITSRVRIKAGGYRHRHAGARRLMTSRAANIAHLQMSRVIELHSKALQAGERFQCSRFHVRVANSADRTFGIRKLLRVTSGTGQMVRRAGTFGNRSVRIATMAKQAGQARMISAVVLKLRIIEPFGKLHLLLRE